MCYYFYFLIGHRFGYWVWLECSSGWLYCDRVAMKKNYAVLWGIGCLCVTMTAGWYFCIPLFYLPLKILVLMCLCSCVIFCFVGFGNLKIAVFQHHVLCGEERMKVILSLPLKKASYPFSFLQFLGFSWIDRLIWASIGQ